MSVKLRERKLPRSKHSRRPLRTQLYLDIYRKGQKRKIEVLPLFLIGTNRNSFENRETRKQAEEIEAKRKLDLGAEEYGLSGSHNRKASFLKYFREQAESRTVANTRTSWLQAVKRYEDFVESAGEGITFGELKPQLLEKYKAFLLRRVSPNAADVYLSRLKTALNEAVRFNLLPVNPANRTRVKRTPTLPVHLSLTEVRRLSRTPCPNEQVKQAFLFSCFTGLRYSDVERLTWANVKGDHLEFTQRKTGEPEHLPLAPEALKILKRQKKAQPSPNLEREHRPDAVFFLPIASVINRQLKAWGKAAGIEKGISFHKSRHSFATIALSSGIDIYTVSKLLGHRSLQTTQIYTKVVDERKRKAVSKMPSL